MIIVIIHWRIKPTDEAEQAFFRYWREIAKIDDKGNLIGEFLSAPIPANQFKFRVDDLTFGHGVLDCRHFMNIGFWKDESSFQDQVGHKMKDDRTIEPFEADRRTRTLLNPREWRRGGFQLPDEGTCD